LKTKKNLSNSNGFAGNLMCSGSGWKLNKETNMARNKDYKYAAPIVTTILNRYPSDRRMRDLEIKRDAARFREITGGMYKEGVKNEI